jgi:ubiquinone/menaquinone biosynthesis C-methylase UbiE
MSFMAKYYDRMLAASEEACLRDWRRQMLASATGLTIEVGAGSGANIEHYPDTVTELILTEPDAAMRQLLLDKRELLAAHHAHVEPWTMDRIEREDNSVDTVVCTLVCCSVPDMATALIEVKRVLKPGGRLIFIEHVAAENIPHALAGRTSLILSGNV